ncbi:MULTISPECIES: secretin N-terminal domain-containing protein [Acidobacteriaceae]|uniref:secretin N-terminal domain-containing protein n=1 Tax=Acidobacteriaceae TaxID=204434 RepID=UPI00131A84E9|nr:MULTISPECIES: secretin N-terminal domain-containing protein [Acidobacteriaceae]MDW5265056.1 secretin N-terminal domain-containing protein [Edaphobacter sp.]
MKLANGILGMALALTLGTLGALAQSAPAAAKPGDESVRTFYLNTFNRSDNNFGGMANDANEIATTLRNILTSSDKILLVPGQNAIVVRCTADDMAIAEKIIKDLDRPKKAYRLTYTITELDGAKSIGTQHLSMVVISGERTQLKQGSRTPIVTGSYDNAKSGTSTQVTYIDTGLNFDVLLDESADAIRLRSKVEQSSVADQPSGVGPQDPIIRQTILEGTSFLTAGKPLVLGSLDIPGSTRRLDVAVVMDPIK